jgi:glutathione peroxidase
MPTAYDFEVQATDGRAVALKHFAGKVLLIVNTASACGFTPQFAGLEEIHKTYGPQGLVVLGFPCNQFGRQDPGSNEEITHFCHANYGVSFPMMAKAPGLLGTRAIKWNFTKFLVGRDGHVVKRYAPQETPAKLSADIESALAA